MNPIRLSNYQLVLFDVDNTLLDFDQSEIEGMRRLWEAYFKNTHDFDTFVGFYRVLNQKIWNEVEVGTIRPAEVKEIRAKRLLAELGMDTKDWEACGNLFLKGLASVATWMPGAETAFERISGKFHVGLITNGLREVQYPRIEKIGIRSKLITYQISEEVGFTKPDPGIFHLALKDTGFDPRVTIYIGDSLSSDFQGARNAGIDFCWYNPECIILPENEPRPKFTFQHWSQILV